MNRTSCSIPWRHCAGCSVPSPIPARAISTAGGVAFASLDVPPSLPHLAGIVQNHQLVGQLAMEQLVIMTDAFQRGVPQAQAITYIPGFWQNGVTAPQLRRRQPVGL